MFVLWKGTCSNCGKDGHLRAVCRNTNTHQIEKDADEPSPEVIVETVWCMAVQDIVVDDHRDHIEKHEGRSEHRDESSRRIKSCGKVITNSETGQNLEKWSGRSRLTNKTQAEDRVRDVKRIRAERVERSKNWNKEHSNNS